MIKIHEGMCYKQLRIALQFNGYLLILITTIIIKVVGQEILWTRVAVRYLKFWLALPWHNYEVYKTSELHIL
jgi:hypothetical protein